MHLQWVLSYTKKRDRPTNWENFSYMLILN